MSMIPYQQGGTLIQSVLPYLVNANNINQAISIVTQTSEYLSMANKKRKQLLALVRKLYGSQRLASIPEGVKYAPVAITRQRKRKPPRYRATKNGMRFTNDEFLATISGNTTFGASCYTMQPGIATTFPWLSEIANNFEQYILHSLKISYVNIAATSERGRVTVAYDRDPLDRAPEFMAELYQYESNKASSVFDSFDYQVPIKPNKLFTRNGTVSGTDLKTYDLGQLIVAVSSTSDTAVIGQLFIEYDIELCIPQPSECPAVHIGAGGTIAKTAPFGDAATVTGNLAVTAVDSTLTFLIPGTYLVSTQFAGSSPGTIDYASGTVTFGSGKYRCSNGSSNGCSTAVIPVRATEQNQTLLLTSDGTTVTDSNTYVTRLNDSAFDAS